MIETQNFSTAASTMMMMMMKNPRAPPEESKKQTNLRQWNGIRLCERASGACFFDSDNQRIWKRVLFFSFFLKGKPL